MDADAVVPAAHVARPFRLHPFRAITLQPSRIGNPASLRTLAGPRTRDLETLRRWQLAQDVTPAIYLHEYTAGGITIRGVVGALDVSRRATQPDEVAVFPHEGIHPSQVADLADRMRQARANPAAILLVHRGTPTVRALLDRVQTGVPRHELTDHAGQRHRVWAINEPDALGELVAALEPTRAVIADGHHRYAAYLRLQRASPGPDTDLGLAMLVDHDDTPLHLGPIHRVLGGVRLDDLLAAARRGGARTVALEAGTALDRLGPDTLVASDDRRWAAIELDLPPGRLAVEALHDDVLADLASTPERITHHHDVSHALADVASRPGVVVLMPAPSLPDVVDASLAGRLLPEKATSFQPKPSVGVLIRSWRDG